MPEQTDIPARAGDSGGARPAESPAYARLVGPGQRWHCRPELADSLLPEGRWPLARWQAEGRVVPVKSGSHRTVYRVESPVGVLYAKQYRVVGWPQRLLHLVRRPAAQREWDSILAVADAGVPTVDPVAWGVVQRGPWVRESWLIVREIADVVPLDELTDCLATHRGTATPIRRKLARAAGRLLGTLHAAGFRHDDLHAGNLLVRDDVGEPALWLIDLHQIRRGDFDRSTVFGPHRACPGGEMTVRPPRAECVGSRGGTSSLSVISPPAQGRWGIGSGRNRDDAARNLALFDHFFRGHATASDRLRFFHAWWDAFHGGSPLPTAIASQSDTSTSDFRAAARWTEALCRAAEPAAHRRRDRKWRRGNRRLIVADRPGVVCRGLAFLGKEPLVAWRDASSMLEDAARAATERAPTPLRVGAIAIPVDLRVLPSSPTRRASWFGPRPDGPAQHAWEMGHAMGRRGIAAVRPLFCIDHTTAGGPAIVGLAAEPASLRAPTRRLTSDDANDRGRARQLADLLRRFHAAGFVHDALSLDAVRVRLVGNTSASESNAMILDELHTVRFVGRLSRRDVAAQLSALAVNIADPLQAGRTARWRFLVRYVDGGQSWRTPESERTRRRDECQRLWRETAELVASERTRRADRREKRISPNEEPAATSANTTPSLQPTRRAA